MQNQSRPAFKARHIDGWIALPLQAPKTENATTTDRLYLAELGQNRADSFYELHDYALIVASDGRSALREAKIPGHSGWHVDNLIDLSREAELLGHRLDARSARNGAHLRVQIYPPVIVGGNEAYDTDRHCWHWPGGIYSLMHLINLPMPLHITLFEQNHRAGVGTPYDPETNDPAMLANIASIELPPVTETLVDWLHDRTDAELADVHISRAEIGDRAFYPRVLIGAYYHDQLTKLIKRAEAQGHAVGAHLPSCCGCDRP